METVEDLPFLINPSFRLKTQRFEVRWQIVEKYLLNDEKSIVLPCRSIYLVRNDCYIISLLEESTLTILYCKETDFLQIKLQKWLQKEIRDRIVETATPILCARLQEREQKHGYKSRSVKVKKLRKHTLGYCTVYNDTCLSPRIFLFPTIYMDMVILHELVHIKKKHHRESFWKDLSKLLGTDFQELNTKMLFDMSHSLAYSEYLMK